MNWKQVFYVLFVAVVAVLSALGGAVAGGAAVAIAMKQTAPAPAVEPQTTHLQVSSAEIETAVTQAVEKVGPAVVTVVGRIPGQMTIFGHTPDGQSSGSGVIISAEGYVVTNNHVVEEADELKVILSDGTELPARLINTDIYADLAVIKAEGVMPAVAVIGDSDQLKVGETVIAIGSPLGEFRNTVTVGVLSATGRSLDTGNGYFMEDLLQTDAAINQGNSGGPLVNLNGEVIGINTMIVRGGMGSSAVAEGLGFAIPSNTMRLIAERIMAQGYFARPYLGIRYQSITPAIARRYNLPVEWGAYVTDVTANSPAAKAGIEVDDIIVAIGGQPIDEKHSFLNALFNQQPGHEVTVEVMRSGERRSLSVTLGEMRR